MGTAGTAPEILTSDHLEEAGARGIELVEANRRSEHAVERAEDERDHDEHGQRPPRHTRVTSVVRWNTVSPVLTQSNLATYWPGRCRMRPRGRQSTTSVEWPCTP